VVERIPGNRLWEYVGFQGLRIVTPHLEECKGFVENHWSLQGAAIMMRGLFFFYR
jgi:hypothetical protein